MILIGELSGLAAEYLASNSSRCRGALRSTHAIADDGSIVFRSDFIRWLGRQAERGDKMILQKVIDRPDLICYVFKRTAGDKLTVEYQLAEAIVALGQDGRAVPCSAIHWCAAGHPFSATQRLREMKERFVEWWVENYFRAPDSPPVRFGMELPSVPAPYRFDRSENCYYFHIDFIDFLQHTILKKGLDKS